MEHGDYCLIDFDLYDECYTLVHDNMWVSVNNFEICIHTSNNGVTVDIYQGSELGAGGEPVAKASAFHNGE